ncbi:MAG: hypothetical protein LBU51_08705 [Bacteroidales bacterium]|jgi:hypothetical protein|nr:hypothetical protein [Bacteroidales bacterium]
MENKIHIGEMVKLKMKEEGRSEGWLSQKMNCTTYCIKKIKNSEDISSFRLKQLTKYLNFNFFKWVGEEMENNHT